MKHQRVVSEQAHPTVQISFPSSLTPVSNRSTDNAPASVLITSKYLTLQRVILGGVVGGDTREPALAPLTNLSTVILHLHGVVWPVSWLIVEGEITEGLCSGDLHISARMV
jgi:hypothetical protein